MTDQIIAAQSIQKSSQIRLIQAVIALWETIGGSGISARQISVAAGVPVSSIYHHFGSLEQLLVVAQDDARAAAHRWCEAQLGQLSNAVFPPQAFSAFFAALIDEWAFEQRQLAFAWREGQLLGARDERFRDTASRWRALWSNFWREACARFGLAAEAVLTERLFENESFLHMFRWRRMVDRAGLDEFARGWTAWLCGDPVPASPWRDFARAEALKAFPPLPGRDETTTIIVEAAADIIGQSGAANLTHRAVAAQAGLTLGVVSHKFRTSADLLRAAFETIYARSVAPLSSGEVSIPGDDRDKAFDGIAAIVRRNASGRGGDELFIATARDPSLKQFAAQLRYLRGRTSKGFLQALLGEAHPVSDLEAALYSGFVSGQIRAHFDGAEKDLHQQIRTELEQLFALIERR